MTSDLIIQQIKSELTMDKITGFPLYVRVGCPCSDCPSRFKNKREVQQYENYWKCYVCKQGGDIFKWVEHQENVDFARARQMLAEKIGIAISPSKERTRLLTAVVTAAHQYLFEHPEKIKYFENRAIPKKILWRHRVGYIDPEGQVLKASGLTVNELLQVGLLYPAFYENEKPVNVMGGRFIFPIRDQRKNIVQLKGRADPEVLPEDTKKSLPLKAKPAHAPSSWGAVSHMNYLFLEEHLDNARQTGFVVIAEGEPDTFTWDKFDFPCVGLQTCNGIGKHAHKFKNIPRIYLALDNDAAASQQIPNELFDLQLKQPDAAVYLVRIPHLAGENIKVDVNDAVAKYGWGRADLKALLKKAVPAPLYLAKLWAPDYTNPTTLARINQLVASQKGERRNNLLKFLSKQTGVPTEMFAFSADPRSFICAK